MSVSMIVLKGAELKFRRVSVNGNQVSRQNYVMDTAANTITFDPPLVDGVGIVIDYTATEIVQQLLPIPSITELLSLPHDEGHT